MSFCEPPPQEPKIGHQLQDWLFRLSRFVCTLSPSSSSGGGGTGTITEVDGAAPISTTNPTGPIVTVTHDASGVTPGTYGDGTHYAIVTVDTDGHVTAASQDVLTTGTVSEVDGTAPISTTNPTGPTVTVTHNTSGVTAATYGDSTHVAQVAINATGHVTSASNVAISAGTVTSVNATVPVEFAVGGVPITGSGTIAITKANETANTVWAGPTTGVAAQPTFRSLVTADMPSGTGTVTSIATTSPILGGTITSTGTISHATSGVTAATYGDSTHVPQIAINATGHITSASNVGIAGVVAGASLLYALVFGG